jgi:endo-1,4-beta-mannosidase
MELNKIMEIKKVVQSHVNNIDPWHLIETGAPEDEYNTQIDHIVSFIVNEKPSLDDIESELYSIFEMNEFKLESDKVKELAKLLIINK